MYSGEKSSLNLNQFFFPGLFILRLSWYTFQPIKWICVKDLVYVIRMKISQKFLRKMKEFSFFNWLVEPEEFIWADFEIILKVQVKMERYARGCSIKKFFWKVLQNSQQNTFDKIEDSRFWKDNWVILKFKGYPLKPPVKDFRCKKVEILHLRTWKNLIRGYFPGFCERFHNIFTKDTQWRCSGVVTSTPCSGVPILDK